MKNIFIAILFLLYNYSYAQFDIQIEIDNYRDTSIVISQQYGEKLKELKVIKKSPDGYFHYRGEFDMHPGIYFIGSSIKKNLFKMIVKPNDDHFKAKFIANHRLNFDFIDSDENKIYRDYYLRSSENRKLSNLFNRLKKYKQRDSLYFNLNKLRDSIIFKNKGSIAALLIKSEMDWIDKKFVETKDSSSREKRIAYKFNHFLDNFELDNEVTLYLPKTHKRILSYFNELFKEKPELVNSKLDELFSKMGYNSEMFRYYLIYFKNKFRIARHSWYDNYYVHIASKYYSSENVPWISDKEKDFVKYQADNKRSTLRGEIIPDIIFENKNKEKVRLLDLESKYTLLIFWKPGCSRCKKAMPYLHNVHDDFKKKGVKLVTVCTNHKMIVDKCWDGINEEKMGDFDYNLVGVNGNTKFLRKFNVTSIPTIFLLDENKKIIDKKMEPNTIYEVIWRKLKK